MKTPLTLAATALALGVPWHAPTYLALPTGRSQLPAAACPVALSRDGAVVAFEAQASLHADDRNDLLDVYVFDQRSAVLELASRAPDGRAAGRSWCPTVSDDGRRVLFHSDAHDLVAGDDNRAPDLFLLDRRVGVVRRVTTGSDVDLWVNNGRLSGDGQVAVFEIQDIVRHTPAAVMRVSLDAPADRPTLIGEGYAPAVSRDGSVVAYVSVDPTGGPTRVRVVHGREARLLGQPVQGRPDGPTHSVALSADGLWAAYVSRATRLLDGRRLSGRPQVYVEQVRTGDRQLVSVTREGQEGDGRSLSPRIAEAGSTVVFASTSSNFTRGDINLTDDVFCWTTGLPFARPVNAGTADDPWLEAAVLPSVSADGDHVAFLSRHPLGPDDDRISFDVLLTPLGRLVTRQ